MNSYELEESLKAFMGKCTIDNSIPDLKNDPVAIKALAEANERMRKSKFPKEFGNLTYKKPGPEWDDAF